MENTASVNNTTVTPLKKVGKKDVSFSFDPKRLIGSLLGYCTGLYYLLLLHYSLD